MDKAELIEQTNLAFDFIQKLYLEVSYLVKEVEAILSEEEEKFVIGKPAGYGISTRSSTGLESTNVNLWLMKRFGLFFVPREQTKLERGQTVTEFSDNMKVLYLRIELGGRNITEPVAYAGVLYDIRKKSQGPWNKFEGVMGHLEYNADKAFSNLERIDYEDAYIQLHGELAKINLYEINNGEAIRKMMVEPVLKLYREH